MDVYVDLVDPQKMGFFISASLGKESISFDYTMKGHRIIKQVWLKCVETKEKPTLSWQSLRVLDGSPKGVSNVEWIDKGDLDMVNGNVYRTVWAKPLPTDVRDILLKFSSTIYKSRDTLDNIKDVLMRLDRYISKLVEGYV